MKSEEAYLFDPVGFAVEMLGWNPDAKQREALGCHGRRVASNWARQCGKSTVCAVKALHMAFTQRGSLTLVLGGVESHLAEFFAKIDALEWTHGEVTGQPGKRMARRFPNGSRIAGVTTNRAVRGHSAALLILDEAGYIEDAVWDGVLPTLAATQGTVWVSGTPNGAQGWYHDVWVNGCSTAWFKSSYPASENPRISRAYLEEMRRMRGEAFMSQEFECKFVHNGRTLLHAEDVDSLFVRDREALR